MSTTSPLPPLYAAWMSELLEGTLPSETRATCDDCAMCNNVAPGASSFNPLTKCCTYLPVLANFLVGQALENDDPEGEVGRASVRARVASGIAVTPLGLGIPTSYGLLYSRGGPGAFGQSVSMRCPHYIEEGGRCGVWRNRNSVCATWFCKHVRGEVGSDFWESVRELLTSIERALSRWCLLELDVGAEAIAMALPTSPRPGVEGSPLGVGELDGRSDPATAAQAWGAWFGRELEFYRACAARVATLDLAGVLRVCGPEVQLRVKVLRAAWEKHEAPDLPERLQMGTLILIRTSKEKQRVSAYSSLDPVEMPQQLFRELHHFDGRPTKEAREAIIADGGPRLTDSLVRRLADFGVLIPAAPPPPPPPDEGA